MTRKVKKQSNYKFSLVDQYMGIRMDVDLSELKPGETKVVESSRRFKKEMGYGFIHALWWAWLEDGRSMVSVPPGAGEAIKKIIKDVSCAERVFDSDITGKLKIKVNDLLVKADLPKADRVFSDISFACNASLLKRHFHGDCRRLIDESIPAAGDLRLPTHCFPDGIVYGVVDGGKVVSIAYAHQTGIMENRVVDFAVGTAEGYRRLGYAKTAVSSVVEYITRLGGEALYNCRPDNKASVATARSVGFVNYGRGLILSVPNPDLK
jgi:ribosomal protein S18 acetylase RimI-like enzyme